MKRYTKNLKEGLARLLVLAMISQALASPSYAVTFHLTLSMSKVLTTPLAIDDTNTVLVDYVHVAKGAAPTVVAPPVLSIDYFTGATGAVALPDRTNYGWKANMQHSVLTDDAVELHYKPGNQSVAQAITFATNNKDKCQDAGFTTSAKPPTGDPCFQDPYYGISLRGDLRGGEGVADPSDPNYQYRGATLDLWYKVLTPAEMLQVSGLKSTDPLPVANHPLQVAGFVSSPNGGPCPGAPDVGAIDNQGQPVLPRASAGFCDSAVSGVTTKLVIDKNNRYWAPGNRTNRWFSDYDALTETTNRWNALHYSTLVNYQGISVGEQGEGRVNDLTGNAPDANGFIKAFVALGLNTASALNTTYGGDAIIEVSQF